MKNELFGLTNLLTQHWLFRYKPEGPAHWWLKWS